MKISFFQNLVRDRRIMAYSQPQVNKLAEASSPLLPEFRTEQAVQSQHK